jgi:ribonuclease HI
MVNQSIPQDKEFFQDHLLQTRSHLHTKSKEVFIFTDDIFALKRISGDLPYPPNGDISSQLEVIGRHSKALDDLGVHIELHLSPGHKRIPGNHEADKLARRTQNRMERNQTCLTIKPAQDELAETTSGPSSRAS